MSWWSKLERRLEPFAIQNLTLFLVIGQAFVYLTAMFGLLDVRWIVFLPAWFLQGEWWRILTFIIMPPVMPGMGGSSAMMQGVFLAFALYFLYLAGGSLEQHLGVLRYNLFLLCGYLLTVGVAFVTPFVPATNLFIGGAIFLAFAYLNPTFTIYVFFILPVQVKWIALLACVGYAYQAIAGGLADRLSVAAAIGNVLLFFGRSFWQDIRAGRRQHRQQAQRVKLRAETGPRHRCLVCGKTSDSHPDLDFRYCSKCAGDQCYCPEHIRNHEHVLTE